MADEELQWPFGTTDGGPLTRPLVVHLDDVLVAILPDGDSGERALATVRELGYADERLRLYTGEQIVAYDKAFRSARGVKGRVVGTFVDDAESMDEYRQYGSDGCSALWVQLAHRDDANSVIRSLADLGLLHVWYHGSRGVETLHLR